MMKIVMTFFWIILITPYLNAQSYYMKITAKDGNHQSIPTADISKITFALDQTHALVVSQKDSSKVNAELTNIANITFSEFTAVEEPKQRSEKNDMTFLLRQNYPNPFNPTTTIEYELPSSGWIKIQIFNLNGQLVRNLESGYFPVGAHLVVWNGENDHHEPATNGIYFYKVQFSDMVQIKKLLLVR